MRPRRADNSLTLGASTTAVAGQGPLLGQEGVEATRAEFGAGRAVGFELTAARSGDLATAQVYLDSRDGATSLMVGIYSNLDGHPGSLLASGAALAVSPGAWAQTPLSSAALSGGKHYWLVLLGEGGPLRLRERKQQSCPAQTESSSGLTALPVSWRTGKANLDCPVSAYVTEGAALVEAGSPPPSETKPVTPPPSDPPAESDPPVESQPPAESDPPADPDPPVESTPPPESSPPSGGSGSGSGSADRDCIALPSACGYPDATDSGVPAGTALSARSAEEHITSAGSIVKDLALTGTIYVEANDVIIEDSEVVVDGSQSGCSGSCGGKGIWIKPGVSGTTIKDVTCRGGAASGSNVTQYCVMSNSASTRVEGTRMYDCTECYTGPGTITDSFLEDNGTISGEHYEDIYYGGGEGALVVEGDTMLNPHSQTAVIFASVDFGDQTTLTIDGNLLAGGGYVIYGGGSGSGGKVIGPVSVKDNRFSRQYYPDGGSYGIAAYMNEAVTEWSGNYWDETLAPVEE